MVTLYDYQEEALDKTEAWLDEDGTHMRGMCVLPTGGGKTVVFSAMSENVLKRYPDKRVVILVHTNELANQTVKALRKQNPNMLIGVVKARLNETTADVIVASVQTLKNEKRLRQIRDVARVIVDECDLAAAPSYVKILEYFGCFEEVGPTKAVGFTATPYRSDGQINRVWQEITFSRPLTWMIKRKFLIPPRGIAITVPDLNLANVKATRADYRDGELGEALADSLAPELVAQAIVEHASDRKVLAFFPTVESSYVFAKAIEDAGIPAEVVHGGIDPKERDAIIGRHKRGTVLVNCMILTVGYDDPEVDCIVIGRPTKSKRLYVQIVGRGLRLDKSRPYDEQDCLLLDIVGANGIHDLRSMADLSEKELDPEKARSGKTLAELEDEFDAGEAIEEEEPDFYRGPVVAKEFDPIGAAKRSKVWIQSAEGTHFVPAGTDAYVFLVEYPKPDSWCVVWCTKEEGRLFGPERIKDPGVRQEMTLVNGTRKNVAMSVHRGLPLERALDAAELLAVDMGGYIDVSRRNAPWRKQKPIARLLARAKEARVPVPDRMKAGELSDLLDKMEGSKRIDPLVRGIKR